MANPAQTGPQSPGNPTAGHGGGPGVPPPPKIGTPLIVPPPLGGGANITPLQVSTTQANRGQQGTSNPQGGSGPQHTSRWWSLVPFTVATLAVAAYLYLRRDAKTDTTQQSPPTPSPAGETKLSTNLYGNYPVKAIRLTQVQHDEILEWKKAVPVAPARSDLYGNVPNTHANPDKWLETASTINGLLVLTIRVQIEALNGASTNKSPQESNKVATLRKNQDLTRAFHITDTSKWVGPGGYAAVVFVDDIFNELKAPENDQYKKPAANGTHYMKPLANSGWPQRWPEYVIERLDGLVKLHEALLVEQSDNR
jgi:hypothetical protein